MKGKFIILMSELRVLKPRAGESDKVNGKKKLNILHTPPEKLSN